MSIPSTHAEVEQLFINAELAKSRSICITSCHSGCGVTSLAMALTERYLLAGLDALIIDLNTNKPSFDSIDFQGGTEFGDDTLHKESWITHNSSLRCFHGVPAPTDPSVLLSYKNPNQLSLYIESWLTKYDRVIFDTSPILNINRGNVPAQVVASVCDHTVLMVLASITSKQQIEKSSDLLNCDQIQLLGTVINAYFQPTLIDELCREVSRLTFMPKTWRDSLKNKISESSFLSTPI